MITITNCKEMGEESIDRSHPISNHQLNAKHFCIFCGKFNPLLGDTCCGMPEGLDSGVVFEFLQLTDKQPTTRKTNNDNDTRKQS